MSPDDFPILMMQPLAPKVVAGIETQFRLHKVWAQPDKEGFLAEVAPTIRGIAAGSFGGGGRFDGPFLSRFPKLEIVAGFGVGYDAIDAAWAGQHGLVVTNTPDVLTDEVADLALGLVIATVRRIPQAERYLRAGNWLKAPFPLSATLRGRTVGILGLGRIGKAIARRLEACGLSIVYHGRHPQDGVPYLYYPTVEGLAAACDILVVVAPGGPDTRHIIDAAVLKALGPSGILINVARGSLVDDAALIAALQDGTIAAAGLDVFTDEPRVPEALLALDTVVALPHIGSASRETRDAMGQLVIDNLRAFAERGAPLTPVAETPWPPVRSR